MEWIGKLVFLVLVAAALWWAMQPRYAFLICIAGGVPRVTRGKVTSAFLQQVGEVCAEEGLSRGWVGGVPRGRQMALVFSRSIPPPCRQRLRNLWALQG